MSYLTGLARFTTLAAQGTQMPAGPSQPARPDPAASRRKRIGRGIMLAWFLRWPLDRRFWHFVAMLAIALGAARASAHDSQARVGAWDARQRERQMKAIAARAARAGRRA
jgi:hypothetical protein